MTNHSSTPAPATRSSAHFTTVPGIGLTERELDVLALMAAGRSNAGVAAHLQIGHKTVETHISSIYNKLGLLPTPSDHRRVVAVLTTLHQVS